MSNRQLGTIERIDAEGNLQVHLDSGHSVAFRIREHPHLDYGYALTSHSAQGATADRVLIHVDSANTNRNLIDSRLAYVAASRARYDARIYTSDGVSLGAALSRSVTKQSALATDRDRSRPVLAQAQKLDREPRAVQTSAGPIPEPARSQGAEPER